MKRKRAQRGVFKLVSLVTFLFLFSTMSVDNSKDQCTAVVDNRKCKSKALAGFSYCRVGGFLGWKMC